jgi:hypothetical protein
MTGTTLSCVKGTSTLVRPKFGPGMLLQADDLDAQTTYTRDLSRLLFRSLFGCGVVCGLDVIPSIDKCGDLTVKVRAGVALGCDGDPIYVPKAQSVTVGDCKDDELPDPPLWVLLCATSKCCAPRPASCGCDDDAPTSTPTRVRDCFEIRVVSELPKCVCCYQADQDDDNGHNEAGDIQEKEGWARADRCPCGRTDGCYADHYAGKCTCCDDCSDDGTCDCNCVLLAKLSKDEDDDGWTADHCVRRFVRPIFMRDPLCEPEDAEVPAMIAEAMVREQRPVARAKKKAPAPKAKVEVKVKGEE